MEFLKTDKSSYIYNVDERGYLLIGYRGPLQNFGHIDVETVIFKKRYYRNYPMIAKILSNLERYQPWIEASHPVRINDGRLIDRRHMDENEFVDSKEPENYIQNPHFKRFNCIGDSEHSISRAFQNGDTVTGLQLYAQAASSINVMESETMGPFNAYLGNEFYKAKKAILDKETNEFMSVETFVNEHFDEERMQKKIEEMENVPIDDGNDWDD